MAEDETRSGKTEAAVGDPTADDLESAGASPLDWQDDDELLDGPFPPVEETAPHWEVGPSEVEPGDVPTALARLASLERTAEQLRAWLLTTDLRSLGPQAVEEIVDRHLGEFTTDMARRLEGLEDRLGSMLDTFRGRDGDDRPFGERVEDAVKEMGFQVAQANSALRSAVADAVQALVGELSSVREQVGAQASMEGLISGLKGLADRTDGLESRLLEAIREMPASTHLEVEGLTGKLTEFTRALLEALQGSIGQIHAGLTEGIGTLRERIESLERIAGAESGDLIAGVRDVIERAERSSAETRAEVEELNGRLAEFTRALREAFQGSMGQIQADFAQGFEALRERLDTLDRAGLDRQDGVELASVRAAMERIERGLLDRDDELTSVRAVIERIEGSLVGRDDELASLRTTIERMKPGQQVDVESLSAGLSEPAERLRGLLESAMVEIREGFARVVAELRERIEFLEGIPEQADEAALDSIREGIERLGLASRDDIESLVGRFGALEATLREALLGSLGGIRSGLDEGLAGLRDRLDLLERNAAKEGGEDDLASVREAVERIERASQDDLGKLSARVEDSVESLGGKLGEFSGALTSRLGEFAETLRGSLASSIGEIQTGFTAVVDDLRERIDSLERDSRHQVAAARKLETEIGESLAGLAGVLERLVGTVDSLQSWWGGSS